MFFFFFLFFARSSIVFVGFLKKIFPFTLVEVRLVVWALYSFSLL